MLFRSAVAQRARDRNHALQVQLQKIVAAYLAAALERHRRDLLVGNPGVNAVYPAQSRDIRNRLDIKDQNWRQQ